MKNRHHIASPWRKLALILLGLMPVAPLPAAQPLTLDDYYAAALQRSENVAIQNESIRQAEERYRQATSALLPTVNGLGSYLWQDPTADTGSSDSSSASRQRLARLNATQPLFRGFREFAALRQTKAELGAQNQDYRQARVQLFKDVTQNFYNVLSIEQDLKNIDGQIELTLKREKELQDRVRIGRSRIGEVLTVQSTVSTLRSQSELLKGQLLVAREVFAFLSGLDASTPLHDTEILPTQLESMEDYMTRAALRPDVLAARQRVTAAHENIDVARGAHLPSLDLSANRYLERSGPLRDIDWDVQLALIIPIYAGGSTQSRVREAASLHAQAELSVSQINRLAEQEIHSIYQSLVFDRSQVQALEKSTDAARKNYEAQLHDYRLGLVTNLDVLQALTAFQENQRALDRSRYTMKLDYLRLQAAAARRPALPEGTAP